MKEEVLYIKGQSYLPSYGGRSPGITGGARSQCSSWWGRKRLTELWISDHSLVPSLPRDSGIGGWLTEGLVNTQYCREFGNAETCKEENENKKHSQSHCPEKSRVNLSEHFLALKKKKLCVGECDLLF